MHEQDGAHVHGDGPLPRQTLVLQGGSVHQLIGRPFQQKIERRRLLLRVQGQVPGLRCRHVLWYGEHVVLAWNLFTKSDEKRNVYLHIYSEM